MSELLDVRVELAKLARLLDSDTASLEYLEPVGSGGLRALREQLVELFFGGEIGGLKRLVAPTRILPASVIAALTKEAVGPVLSARIAGLVDPDQAISVVAKLPIKFVADIAVNIDPRRIQRVIGGLPTQTIAEITAELVKRREFVAIGRFISYVDDDQVVATFDVCSDADLLQIAFVYENKERLQSVVALMSDDHLRGAIAAAGNDDLWVEALDLLTQIHGDQYQRVIDISGEQPKKSADGLVKTAHTQGLWSVVIPVMADTTDPTLTVDALNRASGPVIKSFVDEVVKGRLWSELETILKAISPESRAEFRKRVSQNRRLADLAPVEQLLD